MAAATNGKRNRFPTLTAFVLAAGLVVSGLAQAAAVHLTDSAVFSSNGAGENWNGWIWNTQGLPADGANRWNLYYSSSSDPQNPVFLNAANDAATNIRIEMTPGTHRFLVYGESVTPDVHPDQHFVLNLYFDDHQAAPDISGLFGSTCTTVCAASHWNGLDLFGNSGEQEAGTLVHTAAGLTIELVRFDWSIDGQVDKVWELWGDTPPYSDGSRRPDFVGEVWLRVSAAVPTPGSLALWMAGIAGLVSVRSGSRGGRTLRHAGAAY